MEKNKSSSLLLWKCLKRWLLSISIMTMLFTNSLPVKSQDSDVIYKSFNMATYDLEHFAFKDSVFIVCLRVNKNKTKLKNYVIQCFNYEKSKKFKYLYGFEGDYIANNKAMKQAQLVEALSYLKQKFVEWSETAINNNVTDFSKRIEIPKKEIKLVSWYVTEVRGKEELHKSYEANYFICMFRVTADGDCLLEIKKVTDGSRLKTEADASLIFSSPDQIQSLIDAITI